MKKMILFVMVMVLAASVSFAEDAATVAAAVEKMTLSGDIIDNMCSADAAKLAETIKTHDKTCLLKPDCAAAGYGIYSEGKLYKFDEASNAKVAEFLKAENSKAQVTVEAEQAGDLIKVDSIKNQE